MKIVLIILALFMFSCKEEQSTCYIISKKEMVYSKGGYPHYWMWVRKNGNFYEKQVDANAYFRFNEKDNICFKQ